MKNNHIILNSIIKNTAVALLTLVACTANLQAQGLIVYKTDGSTIKLPAEEVQRIAAYDYGEDPVTPGGDTGEAPAGAKAVDLGLPSGTKWANMNIGATSPQESGLYFAWGETTGYTSDTTDGRLFDWANYKWMADGQSDWMYINKYQIADGKTEACWYEYDWDIVDYKFIGDSLTVLEVSDDAAAANWGGDWRMPTIEDYQELLANCTSEWITVGNVSGRKFTSKVNGNAIFFPAAGYRDGGSLDYVGARGFYWSASLSTSYSSRGRYLYFYSGDVSTGYGNRYFGQSVRAVLRN